MTITCQIMKRHLSIKEVYLFKLTLNGKWMGYDNGWQKDNTGCVWKMNLVGESFNHKSKCTSSHIARKIKWNLSIKIQ